MTGHPDISSEHKPSHQALGVRECPKDPVYGSAHQVTVNIIHFAEDGPNIVPQAAFRSIISSVIFLGQFFVGKE
jgi:hypothetical protein